MTTYYYDDDCPGDHFKQIQLPDDEAAILFGERMRNRYRPKNCIVYKEGEGKGECEFITIKEWDQQ